MGCAYGNVAIAALEQGAKVIACDMEAKHFAALRAEVPTSLASHLTTVQGVFPADFNFPPNTIAAIYASHLLEFLSGDELEKGIEQCF